MLQRPKNQRPCANNDDGPWTVVCCRTSTPSLTVSYNPVIACPVILNNHVDTCIPEVLLHHKKAKCLDISRPFFFASSNLKVGLSMDPIKRRHQLDAVTFVGAQIWNDTRRRLPRNFSAGGACIQTIPSSESDKRSEAKKNTTLTRYTSFQSFWLYGWGLIRGCVRSYRGKLIVLYGTRALFSIVVRSVV